MTQTVGMSFDGSGREVRSPVVQAQHMTLTRADAAIEFRVNGGAWTDLDVGARVELPNLKIMRDILFRSKTIQDVRISFDVITTGRADILGAVTIDNSEALRQTEVTPAAREQYRLAFASALEGNNEDLSAALTDGIVQGIVEGVVGGIVDPLTEMLSKRLAPMTETLILPPKLIELEAVEIAGENENRRDLLIQNRSKTNPVYVGGENVTPLSGLEIIAGASASISSQAPIFAISIEGESEDGDTAETGANIALISQEIIEQEAN